MIDYLTFPELPGKLCFYCTRRNATLQVTACATQWKLANNKAHNGYSHQCQTCSVGALHAGEGELTMSQLRGKQICARCFRVGMRLIGGDLCVSCWNRQREVFIGINARGNKPIKHPPISPFRAAILCGNKVIQIKRNHAISNDELIVATLRDSTRQVFFGLQLTGTNTEQKIPVQRELFDDSDKKPCER